jgi:ElaB/YqjD/DUF883 family membrane-anchored ribosome-binding protein
MKDVIEGQELCADDGSTDAEILEVVLTGVIAKPANQVADKMETARDSAADALEGAASTLQEKRGTVSGISNLVRELSNRLEAAAHYVRRFDAREFISSTKECAKKYPATWLTVSVAVGFAVGWSIRRR